MTSMLGAVKRCISILWPWKATEQSAKGVIPPVYVKYRRTPQEKTTYITDWPKDKIADFNMGDPDTTL
jgi:hypothetical protein